MKKGSEGEKKLYERHALFVSFAENSYSIANDTKGPLEIMHQQKYLLGLTFMCNLALVLPQYLFELMGKSVFCHFQVWSPILEGDTV